MLLLLLKTSFGRPILGNCCCLLPDTLTRCWRPRLCPGTNVSTSLQPKHVLSALLLLQSFFLLRSFCLLGEARKSNYTLGAGAVGGDLRWHGLGFPSCPSVQMSGRTIKVAAEPCLPFADRSPGQKRALSQIISSYFKAPPLGGWCEARVEGTRPSGKRQWQNWQQPEKETLRTGGGAGGGDGGGS